MSDFRVPELLNDSKKRYKLGSAASRWSMDIGPNQVDAKLISATATYSISGTSGMRFVCGRQLSGWENYAVKLRLHYGDNGHVIFRGRIKEVKDHASGLWSEGVAYGVSELMGTRYFCERVSYKGWTLTDAYEDIMDRAEINTDSWEILDPGDDEVIEEDHDILPETSFFEGLGMLLESFDFAQYDRLRDGVRMEHFVKPRPQFGYWRNRCAEFSEKHITKDTWSFKPGLREFYKRVVVFRRGDNTSTDSTPEGPDTPLKYEVYAEHAVNADSLWGISPKNTNVMWVPDFFGSQGLAKSRATKWAKALRHGAGTFEMEMAPLDLRVNDCIGVRVKERVTSFRLTRILEQIKDVDVDVGDMVSWLHACLPEDIEYEVGPGISRMRLSGRAIKLTYSVVKQNRFQDVIDVSRLPLEPAVRPPISPEFPSDGFLHWGDESSTFADLTADYSELT